MSIKKQWKIGKGMKNTLPLHIGKPVHKHRIVEEPDEKEAFRKKRDEVEQEEESEVEIEYPSKPKLSLPTLIEASPFDSTKDKMLALGANRVAQAMLALTSEYYYDEEKAICLMKDAMLYLNTARRIK